MIRTRATRIPLLTVLACLLLVAPALAGVPDRDGDGNAARPEPASWIQALHEAVVSIAARFKIVVREEPPPAGGDKTPGAGVDPDGHKPPTE